MAVVNLVTEVATLPATTKALDQMELVQTSLQALELKSPSPEIWVEKARLPLPYKKNKTSSASTYSEVGALLSSNYKGLSL